MLKICNADLFSGRKNGICKHAIFMRYASKQCTNIYQIHSWSINAVLTTFEAKKSINFISKNVCPILRALKKNKQYS